MKKLLSMLLAFSLLFCVFPVLAEEAAEETAAAGDQAAEEAEMAEGEAFPYIPFGMEMKDATPFVEGYYGNSNIHFNEDSVRTYAEIRAFIPGSGSVAPARDRTPRIVS